MTNKDMMELLKIMADETNVKSISLNGKVIYQCPRMQEKQKQFETIFGEE